MSDNNSRLLDKYTNRGGESSDDLEETETMEDFVSFGWLRGIRDRALSLELRLKTGNILAVGYSYIEKLEFDASGCITLYALGQTYRIKGRNLNTEMHQSIRLFEGLCRHRVPFVKEADQPANLRADDAATVVEQIECD